MNCNMLILLGFIQLIIILFSKLRNGSPNAILICFLTFKFDETNVILIIFFLEKIIVPVLPGNRVSMDCVQADIIEVRFTLRDDVVIADNL
jgi:hypothetical protein